jgi:hypothetical protein
MSYSTSLSLIYASIADNQVAEQERAQRGEKNSFSAGSLYAA